MGCLRLDILEQDYKSCEQKMFAVKNNLTLIKSENKERSEYLYGMNTQEKDDEIFEGAWGAKYWEYDSRIGRRWNIDPVLKDWESPYVCFSDNPIFYSDPNGDDPPKRFSAGQRLKNWVKGDSYKNKANAYAVKNKIDEANIKTSDGKITINESYYTTGITGHNNDGSVNQSAEYHEKYTTFEARGGGRRDLGNFIRGRAGSEFSQNLFQNYWQAGGNMTLSQSRFNSIVKAAGNVQGNPTPVTLANGQPGIAKVHSFYGSSEYAKALGSATIYYNQVGTPVGFNDTYNFNWRFQWGPGSRSIIAEQQTRGVSIAGFLYGAQPFNITYGIGVRP